MRCITSISRACERFDRCCLDLPGVNYVGAPAYLNVVVQAALPQGLDEFVERVWVAWQMHHQTWPQSDAARPGSAA